MLAFLMIAMMVHPVHESVAEVEWNRDTGRLEVALRLDAIDEQWLRKRMAQKEQQDGQWELTYLRRHFRIAEPPAEGKSDSTTYRWIGRDEERGHVWWYFEMEPENKLPPRWIQQRVLFEKEEIQANRVIVLGGLPKRTIVLTIQHPKAFLNPIDEDESQSTPQIGR